MNGVPKSGPAGSVITAGKEEEEDMILLALRHVHLAGDNVTVSRLLWKDTILIK